MKQQKNKNKNKTKTKTKAKYIDKGRETQKISEEDQTIEIKSRDILPTSHWNKKKA